MKKAAALAFLLFCLSACGFHLRTYLDVPPWLNNVSVISQDEHNDLVSILRSQLEQNHIRVNPDPATAQYWLMINNINLRQQIISIGASTNPRQYQLVLSLEFVLQSRKGEIVRPAKLISVSRQLTINNDRILGSNAEEITLIREMKRDLVIQIINALGR